MTDRIDQELLTALRREVTRVEEDAGSDRGMVARLAQATGRSYGATLRRVRKLEALGLLTIEKCKTYDSQPHRDAWGHSLFGGAGVCVRRYLRIRERKREPVTLADAFAQEDRS